MDGITIRTATARDVALIRTVYHNWRKAIFSDDSDRQAFLEKLQRSLAIYQAV
jgi:hypothetical protein